MVGRALALLGTVLLVSLPAEAGTRDEPEIADPVGDHPVEWLDIRRIWVEDHSFDVVHITMELSDYVPTPPDLRTGGLFTGAYFRVDFDLVDWNGTRIGNRDDQHVAISIEETMIITYVCVWDQHEDHACEEGFGCCHGALATIQGRFITWEVDFKEPMGEAWTVGSGYRFDGLHGSATFRALSFPTEADLAPDSGNVSSASPPTIYRNVRTEATGIATVVERAAVAAGVLVLTGLGVGAARLLYKIGRYRFLKWVFLGLFFTRIPRDQVLENERRATLFQLVQENPGITFSQLRRRAGFGSGCLVHHVSILDRQGFVRCVQDGFRSRFYLRGAAPAEEPYLSRTQQELLKTLESNPGIVQKNLARLMGLPRQSLRYHVGRLERAGMVRVQRDGRWRRHFVA